jgi:chemotaxis signal transduction protein
VREVGATLVSVGVQSLEVAIRAEFVREVLGARSWVQLPGAREEVPGVVVWGGRAVALVDLARFQTGLMVLGPSDVRSRLVIIVSAGSTLALPADRVSEVWKTHEDNVCARQLRGFELARSEVVTEDRVLPLFEPELLLQRLGVQA